MLSPHDWHQRFLQQAQWTRDLRDYLFQRAQLQTSSSVLEVGCGTGAILAAIQPPPPALHGLDIDLPRLQLAKTHVPHTRLTCADAHHLPYEDHTFNIIFSHYLFLWLTEPVKALQQCLRTLRPGGALIAIAEPDYGGRIDYPPDLQELGALQTQALSDQGADPNIGRQVKSLFAHAGLKDIETGVLSGQWHQPPAHAEWQLEWQVLADDLKGELTDQQLEKYKQLDWQAWQGGERIMFIPTFYAIGFAP